MIRYSVACIWLLGIIGQRKLFVKPFLLDTERCHLKTPTTYNHGDFCYEFYLEEEVYWHDAKTACEHRGGYLATIDSMNVQNFIMDRLRALGFSHNGIWIGLNDESEELQWRWADGTPLGSFQYWGSGESNQFLTHFVEDCVHLRYTDGGRWHDSPCDSFTHKYNYICQSNILPTRATTLVRTKASTLRTATTKATTTTTTTTQQRTQKLSTNPEQEYTETSVSAPTMQTSTTRIPRMPTETSNKAVTIVQTAPTTTHTDKTTQETETTTTPGSTSTMKTTTTTTTTTTTAKPEKETTMTPISTSGPITTSTTKTTTSATAKPTTSTTRKLATNAAMTHTSTTISRRVTTSTNTPTTMKSTMSTVTTTKSTMSTVTATKSTMSTATTTKSTTQSTTGREVDPCTGFTCKLDCGILGYVYSAIGCPECACAT